jgi:hypothetical protein
MNRKHLECPSFDGSCLSNQMSCDHGQHRQLCTETGPPLASMWTQERLHIGQTMVTVMTMFWQWYDMCLFHGNEHWMCHVSWYCTKNVVFWIEENPHLMMKLEHSLLQQCSVQVWQQLAWLTLNFFNGPVNAPTYGATHFFMDGLHTLPNSF